MQNWALHTLIALQTLLQECTPHFLVLAMSSDNNDLDLLAGSDCNGDENPTDQDSMRSCLEGLVPLDGSHLGSVSADSIDPDSIADPLAVCLLDKAQQERGAEALNLVVEMEILGSEFGCEDPLSIQMILERIEGSALSPRAD